MTFKRKYTCLADVLANTTSSGTCMLWNSAHDRDGYPACNVYGLFKSQKVHREVFRLVHGHVPPVVMHACDTPSCINPDHLIAGTEESNLLDKLVKGRQARGSTNGRAVLDEEKVLRMRSRKDAGASYAELMKEFGVSEATVWRVLSGTNWGHLGCSNT